MEQSIRYDVSLGMRLLRAVPVVAVYFGIALAIFVFLPDRAREIPLQSIAVLGFIGAWRYLWLVTHCVRAALYEYYKYPKLQFQASQLPEDKKYPGRLFFLIPTWKEKPEVTRSMLRSILSESVEIPSKLVLFVNAGSDEEDDIFREIHSEHPQRDEVDMYFVRQVGGKRQGMADCLYKLSEFEIDETDIVALMDGDTVLGSGILEKCLPLFGLLPKVAAITTDNIAVTKGNWLYRKWYTLRFSMRHRYMKSLSLSNQLQVLTGRFSLFRAKECVEPEFISSLENDRIKHWLHGEIQFVTGDDKSTWYTLLKKGSEMLYVPDAIIYCMEDSGPEPIRTSIKKMHRWFGNMLRNNGRAISLGLGRQRPFIWWCHVDQRLSMYTSLLGPVSAIWAAIWLSPYYLLIYAILVLLVRTIYILILTIEGHRLSLVDIPMLLYTQWIGSIVKIYTMFHLHHQKWDSHRTDMDGKKNREPFLDYIIPKMEMTLSYVALLVFVISVVGTK
ncbi:MAG: glycosyltransferase [Mariniblastus sp.]